MILSDETKQLILAEYEEFKDSMYAGKTKEERDELAQFFTPPEITFALLSKYKVDSLAGLVIRDPTCGSGNLLAACLIAGADSDKIYGNDYDATMVKLCRDRLNRVCRMLNKPELNDWQIHQGNALQARCLIEFGEEYDNKYNPDYIDDLDYAQSYEHDEEQTFLGETTICHMHKLSWVDENKKAQERLEKKQQLEKRNTQKVIEKTEKTEQVDLFGGCFNE